MVTIGQLRQRVTVENPTRVPDGDGGFTDTWTELNPADIWASIVPATASVIERQVGNTIEAQISHVVTCRYHDEISTLTRITFDSKYLFVRGIQNVESRNEWLVLACEEIAS